MLRLWRFSMLVAQTAVLAASGCGAQPKAAPNAAAAPAVQPAAAPLSENTTDLPPAAPAADEPDEALPAAPTAEPQVAASPQPTELARDSFADVQGSIRWQRDGVKSSEGPPGLRTCYFFHDMPEGGPLAMKMVEDHVTTGPDGQPGVLALSWQEIPARLRYSGFTYLGGKAAADRLTLPPLLEAKAVDDLRTFRLSFHLKGLNEGSDEPFNRAVGCRLEPLLADSYNKRLDFGNLSVTGQWIVFEVNLADGANAEAFLRAIAEEKPASFKIVWSQAGPLTAYKPGDTLLIDDVLITHAAAP